MFDYNHHIGDFRTSTGHLTDLEELAYRRLLEVYYSTEQPIPLDLSQVARKIKSTPEIVGQLMKDFFSEREDGYHNKRCDIEIELYRQRCEKNSKAGKASARKRAEQSVNERQHKGNERSTLVEHPLNERQPYQLPSLPTSPVPTTPFKDNISSADKQPTTDRHRLDRFEEVWSAYQRPDGKGSKKKAIEEWKKLTLEQKKDAWSMVDEYLKVTWQEGGKFRPHVERYLKNRLWEGLDTNNGRVE